MKLMMLTPLLLAGLAAAPAAAQDKSKADGARHEKAMNRFDKLDANHDGSISREEWKGRAKAFDRIDSNHDGVLSRDEIRAVARARRHKPV